MTPVNDVKASRAFLAALTAEGSEALHGSEMEIAVFPFRVGRESRRFESRDKQASFADKRKPTSRPNNDLYLVEDAELLSVSREHFQIVRGESGFLLEDRGSTLGWTLACGSGRTLADIVAGRKPEMEFAFS